MQKKMLINLFQSVLSTILAGCAATELPAAVYNGLAYNGLAYNGLAYNGLAYNGLAYNGLAGLPLATTTYAAAPVTTTVAAAATPVVAAAAAPVVAAAAAPVVAAAPYVAGSQFHAQDEFKNVNYGYANLNSQKQEVGNALVGVSGGYSYVDAAGQPQVVSYVADALGFRTEDSRLPVAPVDTGVAPVFNPEPLVAPVYTGVAPEPVMDTPEVAEAKAAHLAAVEAAKVDKVKREAEAEPAIVGGYSTVLSAPALTYAAGLPLAYNGLYNGLYNGAYAYNGLYNGVYGYNGLYNGLW